MFSLGVNVGGWGLILGVFWSKFSEVGGGGFLKESLDECFFDVWCGGGVRVGVIL